MMGWITRAGTIVALVVGVSNHASAGPTPLTELLERELGLLRRMFEVEKASVALRRERDSLAYATAVLEHGGRESLRRLDSYRIARSAREIRVRHRARALYKLARGGMARLVFEPAGPDGNDHAERIINARTVQWLIAHDVRELDVHRRAETRARTELLTATRELQAASGLRTIQAMQLAALNRVASELEPELTKVQRDRNRTRNRIDASHVDRALLRLIDRQKYDLDRGRGLELLRPGALPRPVAGKIVGRFGRFRDRILQLTMTRNGLELACSPGQVVRAVAAGKVAWIGDLPGFERVVVLDHGGGYLSLTGRLASVSVTENDDVAAETELGRAAPKTHDDGLGSTVYFELRHGERPIDPAPWLR